MVSDHTIMVIWVIKIFLCSSSVYSCLLFLISSASVRSVLYCAHLCMKSSLGISNFLEEISSHSHSVVFLYFFALIVEEGFLISPCYSLELCIQMFLLCFSFLFFSQLFVRPPQTANAFLHFFSMGMVLIPVSCTMSGTSVHRMHQALYQI